MKKTHTPFALRLEKELKIRAEKKAAQCRQSLNSWIQNVIEKELSKNDEASA